MSRSIILSAGKAEASTLKFSIASELNDKGKLVDVFASVKLASACASLAEALPILCKAPAVSVKIPALKSGNARLMFGASAMSGRRACSLACYFANLPLPANLKAAEYSAELLAVADKLPAGEDKENLLSAASEMSKPAKKAG